MTLLAAEATTAQTTWMAIYMAVSVLGIAALAARGLQDLRRKGHAHMFPLLVAGAIGVLLDPGFTLLANLGMGPTSAMSPSIYSMLGQHQPLWTALFYPLWIAGPAYVTFHALEERWPRRRLWTVFLVWSAADVVGEIPAAYFGLYVYQGQQPFQAGSRAPSPTWGIGFIAMAMLMGALMHHFARDLRGPRVWLTLPFFSGGYLAFLFIVCWPSVIAVQHTYGQPWVFLLGVLTLVTQCVTIHLIALRLPLSEPSTERDQSDALSVQGPGRSIP